VGGAMVGAIPSHFVGGGTVDVPLPQGGRGGCR